MKSIFGITFFLFTCISFCQDSLINSFKKSGVTIEEYLIKTSDTSEVSVLVGRKFDNKKRPTIFTANIYISDWEYDELISRVQNGYNGVIMNPRGKRKSSTPFHPFNSVGKDAIKIIDWITHRTWSDEQIGLTGGSYSGWAVWNILKYNHPAIKTALPVASTVWGMDGLRANGIGYHDALRWDKLIRNKSFSDYDSYFNNHYWDSISRTCYEQNISFKKLDSLEGQNSPFFQECNSHQSFDSYWSNLIPNDKEFSNIDIPILSLTGYYDFNQTGTLYYYKSHLKNSHSKEHYLLLGPYTHFGVQNKHPNKNIGAFELDKSALLNLEKLKFQWFDYVFKKGKKPTVLKNHICFQVIGRDNWEYASNLNTTSNDTLTFYLSNKKVNTSYILDSNDIIPNQLIESQYVDYNNRTDFDSWNKKTATEIISTNLNDLDNITFYSVPLKEDIILSNSFFGNLTFRTNQNDADIEIIIYEKTIDNKYFTIVREHFRSSFILSPSDPQQLLPNQISTVPISNTMFVGKKLNKGSQIIIALKIYKGRLIDLGDGKYSKSEFKIDWLTGSYISLPVTKK